MYSKSPRARHQATAGPKGIKQGAAGGHPVIPSLSNACLAVSQCVCSLPKCLRGGVLHKEVRPPPLCTIHYALSMHYAHCTGSTSTRRSDLHTAWHADMAQQACEHHHHHQGGQTSTSPLQLAHPCWQNPNGDPPSTLLCFFEEHNKVANIISNKFQWAFT